MTIHKVPFTLLGYLIAVGMLSGGMVCGWLCPMGLIQELMYKIKSFKIKIRREFSALRYFVLLFLVILIPVVTQETWFSKLCPMGTVQAALPWAIWNPVIPVYNEPAVSPGRLGLLFAVKLFILVFFLGMFIISRRPFCRTVCPLGAVLGIFNRYSVFRLKVDTSNCKDCGKCAESCPVDLRVASEANATTCVRCLKCLSCENVKLETGGLREKIGILR
ncbi:4Fe-4S binding protein [Candidatus Hydrogenedentota bacterium]